MKEKREDGRIQAILGEQIVDVPPSPVPPLKDIPCWNEDPPHSQGNSGCLGQACGLQGGVNFPVPRSSWRLGSGFVRQLGLGTRSCWWALIRKPPSIQYSG